MQFNKINKFPKQIDNEIKRNISRVIKHNRFIMGPEVQELEAKLKGLIGAKFCLGVSSGTDALLISLMALGVKRGDEIIVPSFSWISTASVIKLLDAKPIFIDIENETCNIDIKKLSKAISKKTKGIIFTSLFGNVPDVDKINKIAKNHKLFVIEDGAQSFGAKYKSGYSCNLTTIGCTSFFPSKPLGAFGDAGAIFTNNKNLFKKMRAIRIHGQIKRHKHDLLGLNGRIDTIQCAVLLAKIKCFKNELNLRKKKYNYYKTFFLKNKFKNLTIVEYEKFGKSAFAQFCLLTKKRNFLIKKFKTNNIPYAIYYPKTMDQQKLFGLKNYNKNFISINSSKQIISIPFSPYISKKEQDKVLNVFIKYKKYL